VLNLLLPLLLIPPLPMPPPSPLLRLLLLLLQADTPPPSHPGVLVEEVPEMQTYVLEFPGYMTERTIEVEMSQVSEQLCSSNMSEYGAARI